tara:strand:+ start:701 stop:1120 length:420 start_codon:yes stop_codon:yes gene_type:complete
MKNFYGTCVAFDGKAVLFRGPPGSGKSDLALRSIYSGGQLIADDQTTLVQQKDKIIASCPKSLSNKLEVRGIGLVEVPCIYCAPLISVFDMVPSGSVERFPKMRFCSYLGVKIPLFTLAPFEASAVCKVTLSIDLVTTI